MLLVNFLLKAIYRVFTVPVSKDRVHNHDLCYLHFRDRPIIIKVNATHLLALETN